MFDEGAFDEGGALRAFEVAPAEPMVAPSDQIAVFLADSEGSDEEGEESSSIGADVAGAPGASGTSAGASVYDGAPAVGPPDVQAMQPNLLGENTDLLDLNFGASGVSDAGGGGGGGGGTADLLGFDFGGGGSSTMTPAVPTAAMQPAPALNVLSPLKPGLSSEVADFLADSSDDDDE
jgi:hypothetical protein